MSSSCDKAAFYRAFAKLRTLPIAAEEDEPLNTVTACMSDGDDDFFPEIIQIIQQRDGLYFYHHLAPHTHKRLESYYFDPDRFIYQSVMDPISISLTEGDHEVDF